METNNPYAQIRATTILSMFIISLFKAGMVREK
jgi:hypothetical protein